MSRTQDFRFEEAPQLPLEMPNSGAMGPLQRGQIRPIQSDSEELSHRFLTAGPANIADLELLQIVLLGAVPGAKVKRLSRQLITTFGDFNHVISAPPEQLRRIAGLCEASLRALKVVEAAAHRLARARVIGRPALSCWSALMEYCKVAMAHQPFEEFRVLFLDRRNVLIADEAMARGTVDHVPVYPREVVKRALEMNASAIILVHNHPSGDPTPSEQDIAMTERILAATDAVGIALHDHVVIGKESDSSFRSLGLL